MRLGKLVKGLAALAATALVVGCTNYSSHDDFDGVTLAELDRTGTPPDGVSLRGPDSVVVTQGEAFEITVEGEQEARDLLRFAIEDEVLKIGRASGSSDTKATIRVTLPQLRQISLGGSGTVDADRITGQVGIAIGGSGRVSVAEVDAEVLDLAIGGSGAIEAAGRAQSLDLAIGGSGSAKMRDLKVDRADISIGGSGDAAFGSDGTVEATIAGSGDVTVYGNAKCQVSSFGSGSLRCEAGETATTGE